MVAAIQTESQPPGITALPPPDPLPDGTDPEGRIVVCGLSWESYLAFDKALGDNRPSPRFYYLDGELEIMTTSNEHERIKTWLAGFVEDFFLVADFEIAPRGHVTMRTTLKDAGAEPDESWCIGEKKEFPDLVLEIALTNGGIRKLDIYARFKVPEVWIWQRGKLNIYTLNPEGTYAPSPTSRLLPELDIALIEHCVAIRSWREARQTFRAGLRSSG